jgi:hypothetical protein
MRKVKGEGKLASDAGPANNEIADVGGGDTPAAKQDQPPPNTVEESPSPAQGAVADGGPRWLSPDADLHGGEKPRADYQELWLAVDTGWRSLALVATAPGVSEQEAGAYLAATGLAAGSRPVALLDATGIHLAETDSIVKQVHALVAKGTRVILVLESLSDNSAGIPIVRAVDAAVLVVRPRLTELGSIERIVELAGQEHILGIVTRPARGPSRAERRRNRRSSGGAR